MKKRIKKKSRKKKINKNSRSSGLLPILAIIAMLALFSETMKTLPAGASSEKFLDISFELPVLNNVRTEKKLIENAILINQKFNFQTLTNKTIDEEKKEKIIISKAIKKEFEEVPLDTFNISDIQTNLDTEEIAKIEKKIIVAKAPEAIIKKINLGKFDKEIVKENLVDIPKLEETIKIAADTSTKSITVEGEEILVPGSSEKNITYMQILQNPNDLDLNLKYAQQQGKVGNFKQTIATLERLNMIYPDNVEIKLYLLSVLVQADSPNKALTVIEEIKASEDVTPEDINTVNEIEEEMKSRGAPKLWNFYASVDLGGIQNNNVNSVSKTRLQSSSDELIGFNSAKIDRTYSGSLGLTAVRTLGETSAFTVNVNGSDSDQEEERGDDFESYGLTIALDTTLGNQSLAPYFMLSKTDYQDDADSFSMMYGIGGSFSVGERNSFSYTYTFSDSKGNQNSTDTTAADTNAIGHNYTLGHDYMINDIISTSLGIGYSDSDGNDDTNDFETYDFNLRVNFGFPWLYISVGEALSFNDYKVVDTSTNSSRVRSDVTNTFDIMLTKALGDFLPKIDPNKSFFLNFSFEKVFSEANIINYDYIGDSISFSISKSIHLNK